MNMLKIVIVFFFEFLMPMREHYFLIVGDIALFTHLFEDDLVAVCFSSLLLESLHCKNFECAMIVNNHLGILGAFSLQLIEDSFHYFV